MLIEPLKDVVRLLVARNSTGLWLNPYRGIPLSPALPQFDVIYLDQDNRVSHPVERFPDPQTQYWNGMAATALLLPVGTPFAAQIEPGDLLVFNTSGKMAKLPVPDKSEPANEVRAASHGPRLIQFAARPTSEEEVAMTQEDSSKPNAFQVEQQRAGKEPWFDRFLRWLNYGRHPSDRRRAFRRPIPGLLASYWTGNASRIFPIADISEAGVYLLTAERPGISTTLMVNLQRMDSQSENVVDSATAYVKVARWGDDGIGLVFVAPRLSEGSQETSSTQGGYSTEALKAFLLRLDRPMEAPGEEISA